MMLRSSSASLSLSSSSRLPPEATYAGSSLNYPLVAPAQSVALREISNPRSPHLSLPGIVTEKAHFLRIACFPKLFRNHSSSSSLSFWNQMSTPCVLPAASSEGVAVTQFVANLATNLRLLRLSELSTAELEELRTRPRIDFSSILASVQPIVDDVRRRGDAAVLEYTNRFDGVGLATLVEDVADMPFPKLDVDVQAAFDVAYKNIHTFHAAQKDLPQIEVETMHGVKCKRVARSIQAVGLYVPGGTAVLPSTALMLAIPARIAGCKVVVLATPPQKDGSICPEVLYCAKKAGVTHILKAGGAQAVAAMAWGTQSCPKVDKILGPGNQYVTAAKMLLQNSEAMVSIDMPAGPSEVLVIADKDAKPAHVASDLLSQAEHGPDSQVVLVAVGDDFNMDAVKTEVDKQCQALPRGDIAARALDHSYALIVSDMAQACEFSNFYAPEHLIVNVENAEMWLDYIVHAGSIFLGRWTPESVGDYASGTNHVLPTYGYARMFGGVSLDSFLKYMTVQCLTEEGLKALGPSVVRMAEVEGLHAHKQAVSLRLSDL